MPSGASRKNPGLIPQIRDRMMTNHTLHPSHLARLFSRGVGEQPLAEIGPGALTVYDRSRTQRLLHTQIEGVRVERGLFWSTLIVQPRTGAALRLAGVSKSAAQHFVEAFAEAEQDYKEAVLLLKREATRATVVAEWIQRGEAGESFEFVSVTRSVTPLAAGSTNLVCCRFDDRAVTSGNAQSQRDSDSRREKATIRPSVKSSRIRHGTPSSSSSTRPIPLPLSRRRPCGVPSGLRGMTRMCRRRVSQFNGERGE
jgi:hypothetical protein